MRNNFFCFKVIILSPPRIPFPFSEAMQGNWIFLFFSFFCRLGNYGKTRFDPEKGKKEIPAVLSKWEWKPKPHFLAGENSGDLSSNPPLFSYGKKALLCFPMNIWGFGSFFWKDWGIIQARICRRSAHNFMVWRALIHILPAEKTRHHFL